MHPGVADQGRQHRLPQDHRRRRRPRPDPGRAAPDGPPGRGPHRRRTRPRASTTAVIPTVPSAGGDQVQRQAGGEAGGGTHARAERQGQGHDDDEDQVGRGAGQVEPGQQGQLQDDGGQDQDRDEDGAAGVHVTAHPAGAVTLRSATARPSPPPSCWRTASRSVVGSGVAPRSAVADGMRSRGQHRVAGVGPGRLDDDADEVQGRDVHEGPHGGDPGELARRPGTSSDLTDRDARGVGPTPARAEGHQADHPASTGASGSSSCRSRVLPPGPRQDPDLLGPRDPRPDRRGGVDEQHHRGGLGPTRTTRPTSPCPLITVMSTLRPSVGTCVDRDRPGEALRRVRPPSPGRARPCTGRAPATPSRASSCPARARSASEVFDLGLQRARSRRPARRSGRPCPRPSPGRRRSRTTGFTTAAAALLDRPEDGLRERPQRTQRTAVAAPQVEHDERQRGQQQERQHDPGPPGVSHRGVRRAGAPTGAPGSRVSAGARRSAPAAGPRTPRRTCPSRGPRSPAGSPR